MCPPAVPQILPPQSAWPSFPEDALQQQRQALPSNPRSVWGCGGGFRPYTGKTLPQA